MSIVLADCGSTSTGWAWLPPGQPAQRAKTQGLNPHFTTLEVFETSTREAFADWDCAGVTAVHFFGAGIGGPDTQATVEGWLSQAFPNAQLHVANDLLGAARAGWGRDAGIICILGTGANRAYFDGEQLHHGPPSLGYILGDEGSGGHLGKLLLRAHFRGHLHPETSQALEAYANVEREHVLAQLFQAPHPNRYLASFARFMTDHQDRPDVVALLNQAFGAFAATALRPLRERSAQVALVGSVAYHFEPHLRRAIAAERMELVRVVRDPIEPLIAFHAQA